MFHNGSLSQISRNHTDVMKGWAIRKHIVNIRQLIEKSEELNNTMVICFIDKNKAFDCINWIKLYYILK